MLHFFKNVAPVHFFFSKTIFFFPSSLIYAYVCKAGIKYLPGGVKSGFKHVDPEDVEKRLFQVKGKRNIKVKQVNT